MKRRGTNFGKGMLALAAIAVVGLTAGRSYAVLVDLGPGSFTPAAPVITFDETGAQGIPLGTTNPVVTFTGLPVLGNETVSFGGSFIGQTAVSPSPPVVTLNPSTPTPGQPLALDPAGPPVFTTTDSAPGATDPELCGTPQYNGPISVLFSSPVAGVGLKGGFFDALNSTTIEAYDANGNVLGSITNAATGFEFYGLADSSGGNVISGISFFVTGDELGGFEIDDLTFGVAGQINNPTPEPASLSILGLGFATLALRKRSRR